ncbi:hypothetical protein BO99DRAFT_116513 [Aspergillus violaceofuscus CBS 115571]|uniref:Uncharacterized protein n=1 Tax=Aspergillus violaceofuscus (strain CBS 115571) TaxID=1450538 RepID=A0A2V5H744_ASPV1|nr:hypothetical protein BO99DRAFT_116513 [Aspergillus violaceofuscus CBS 115571]
MQRSLVEKQGSRNIPLFFRVEELFALCCHVPFFSPSAFEKYHRLSYLTYLMSTDNRGFLPSTQSWHIREDRGIPPERLSPSHCGTCTPSGSGWATSAQAAALRSAQPGIAASWLLSGMPESELIASKAAQRTPKKVARCDDRCHTHGPRLFDVILFL